MDKVIVGKSKNIKYLIIAGVTFLTVLLMAYFSLNKQSSLNVNEAEVLIKAVQHEDFEDFVQIQAKAEPLHAMLVNVIEGGAVQQIFSENGVMVKKGQPLAKLYNPNTELSYLTQETAIIEQINNLNSGKLNIRNQELTLNNDLVMIEHDYNDAKQAYDMNERLFKKDVISKNDWNTIQENFRYHKQRRANIQSNIEREQETNRIQIAQINRSIQTMEKSLAILRANKQNFLVAAPADGKLTSFEPILGKTYSAGESIAKIDVMQGYKLVADIDEFYLDKVSVGQKGTVSYKGKSHEVTVIKVLPEVNSGRFQAELTFLGDQPAMQQGVGFGVKLILSGREKVAVLPKGAFYQETAGEWIFVVNGDRAERRAIKLGRENPYGYEILAGLSAGDKVITSRYTDYKNIQILNIK